MADAEDGSGGPCMSKGVEGAHRRAGFMLDDMEEVALLVDVAFSGFPVVGASAGFRRLTGLQLGNILGGAVQEVMTAGAPREAVSKSAHKNMLNFCSMCRCAEHEQMAETFVVQPRTSSCGSHLITLSLLGLCEVQCRPYVLIVEEPLCELDSRVDQAQKARLSEVCRQKFRVIRERLRTWDFRSSSSLSSGSCMLERADSDVESVASSRNLKTGHPAPPVHKLARRRHYFVRGHRREEVWCKPSANLPEFTFFRERLQERCILANNGFSAMRREKDELQYGCMVFSDRPVRLQPCGLTFRLRVDTVASGFSGLPLLGFTRREPADHAGLYPTASSCLGKSVLVGTGYKAYARDKPDHFVMGFSAPPPDELQTWPHPPPVPRHRQLAVGDVVACVYTPEGALQFWLNEEKLLDFDVGRPILPGAAYYAVVDVCFTVAGVTLLPSAVPGADCAGGERAVMPGFVDLKTNDAEKGVQDCSLFDEVTLSGVSATGIDLCTDGSHCPPSRASTPSFSGLTSDSEEEDRAPSGRLRCCLMRAAA